MKEYLLMKNINKNNIMLTIETTSETCGVSLINNNVIIYEKNINNGFNHSITLFNNISNALKSNNLTIFDVDIIKVSNGPGSFTGIRIGVAAALGLSEKNETQIQYVDTLDSLAYNVIGKNDIIISLIDAKCYRAYISLYFSANLKKISKDIIINIDDLCSTLNTSFKNKKISFALVGSGAVNYMDIFKNNLKIDYKIYTNNSLLKASSLGFVKGFTSTKPMINYLINSKAERERNGKN